MFPLNQRQAQQLVEKLMQDLPYSINLMDGFGRIIASGDDRRIGELHPGAMEAIRLGSRVDIYEDQPLVKKGTNMPIFLEKQIVGVVGITGDPNQVAPFCQIVSTMVILLTEEAIRTAKEETERSNQSRQLERLLLKETALTEQDLQQATGLGIDPRRPLRFYYGKEKWSFEAPQLKLEADEWLMIWQGSEPIIGADKLYGTSNSQSWPLKSAVRQAQTAFWIGQALGLEGAVDYLDVGHLWNRDLSEEQCGVLQPLDSAPELLATLLAYFRWNGEMKAVSAALHIHRNTLLYRLDKIAVLTGKNPHRFIDLQLLVSAWLNKQLEKK
ncbi:CdaR family transcriptional regulator [Listeria ilorinensis]|uniref:CdaR family transcriptional regulator n=1 Tax=Listeria ilorinensis TaxID=2867439 RepID=UPI001EF3F3FC|nr:sugar diacid recognition domain-containing protein [Listeria ilorinensis]